MSDVAVNPRRRTACAVIAVACSSCMSLHPCWRCRGPVSQSATRYDTLDWQHLAVAPFGWLARTGSAPTDWAAICSCGLCYGVRISLLISLVSTAISLVIGVTWGAIAGFVGGRTDELMMRFVDVLYSLPYLFIVIILTTVFRARQPAGVVLCDRRGGVADYRAHRAGPDACAQAP